jgi:hypothetical protein
MPAALVLIVLMLAGCAGSATTTSGSGPPPAPFRARDFRQPAVFVRVAVRAQQMTSRQATELPAEYEGLLLEALNARAIVPRDVTVVRERGAFDERTAIARSREVGADHALLVDVSIATTSTRFCREARRPFTAEALTVRQRMVVASATDGQVRWQPEELETLAIEADCDNPRDSRQRSTTETIQAAIDALVSRLLGS